MLSGITRVVWQAQCAPGSRCTGAQIPSWLTSRLRGRLHSRAGHTGQGGGRGEDEVGEDWVGEGEGAGNDCRLQRCSLLM